MTNESILEWMLCKLYNGRKEKERECVCVSDDHLNRLTVNLTNKNLDRLIQSVKRFKVTYLFLQ